MGAGVGGNASPIPSLPAGSVALQPQHQQQPQGGLGADAGAGGRARSSGAAGVDGAGRVGVSGGDGGGGGVGDDGEPRGGVVAAIKIARIFAGAAVLPPPEGLKRVRGGGAGAGGVGSAGREVRSRLGRVVAAVLRSS